MSDRDGVRDRDYDALRKTGLSRETCFAILSCIRTPLEEHDDALLEENMRQSGVRVPGLPEPDFLEAMEMIRLLTDQVADLRALREADRSITADDVDA